jgi:hypothetical protein
MQSELFWVSEKIMIITVTVTVTVLIIIDFLVSSNTKDGSYQQDHIGDQKVTSYDLCFIIQGFFL